MPPPPALSRRGGRAPVGKRDARGAATRPLWNGWRPVRPGPAHRQLGARSRPGDAGPTREGGMPGGRAACSGAGPGPQHRRGWRPPPRPLPAAPHGGGAAPGAGAARHGGGIAAGAAPPARPRRGVPARPGPPCGADSGGGRDVPAPRSNFSAAIGFHS